MKSSTRLSSAVFQLTPTRTRCDLVIIASDKKEKIASGLLDPFLSHLKIAQEQIAKGGYSILLEPPTDTDTSWFTKATLERFVRFVSTPEVLERVYAIETEIIQIEEAIVMQGSNDMGQINVEDHFPQSIGVSEGDKSVPSASDEKGIVLYQPGLPAPEANGSCSSEGNSKAQLLNILENRKAVLQKEQGMAFARASAAGFDIDHMDPLVSFARCFGAMRLMEACSRFLDLWKRKHETGQWLDVESSRTDFAAMNTSGVILSSIPVKHGDHEVASENNGKLNSTNNTEDNPAATSQREYLQGQFPHHVFSPWPVHGSAPVFPAYPVQGMPYYQPYAGPFLLPHHLPMDHFPSNFNHQSGQKKEALDARDVNCGSEAWETDGTRSQLDVTSETKDSRNYKPRKKSGGSKKDQSGVVVIRNINYITSKQKESGSETESDSSCSGTDTGNGDFEVDDRNVIHKKGGSSGSKGSLQKSVGKSEAAEDELSMFGKDSDDSHWQAFQNCLLNCEDANAENGARGVKMRSRANSAIDDPLALGASDIGGIQDSQMRDIHRISGGTRKPRGSGDDVLLSSHASNGSRGDYGQAALHFAESNGRKILSRTEGEDYIINNQQKQPNYRNSSDALAVNSYEDANHKVNRESSSLGMNDEAFIVPFRSMSLDHAYGAGGTLVNMDTEIPSSRKKSNIEDKGEKDIYEPDCLSLMPERGAEKNSLGVDPALDYEMQVCAEGLEGKVRRNANVKGGLGKSVNDRKSKVATDSLSKQRTGGPIKRGSRSTKMSPIEEARARAERLRSYKADLQKMKKEKEEAEAKRLAKLKRERQKRIAARGNPVSAKPSTLSPQTKPLPSKLPSPIANRGSKFSDSELGSSSPLQRSKIKTSLGSSAHNKTPNSKRLNEGSHNPGNRLTRSSSSIPETKRANNGVTPDAKAITGRVRRLSDPKTTTYPSATSTKAGNAETVVKRKLFDASDKNKMTAIINLDRSKAATLPELKIKPSKSRANGESVSVLVKGTQNVNGNGESYADNCNTADQINTEENQIVEKTVVMLEKSSVPKFPSLGTNSEKLHRPQYDHEKGERSKVITALDPKQAPVASINGVDRETISNQLPEQSHFSVVKIVNSLEKHAAVEKPYRAPHARNSSLENPCTGQSEYALQAFTSSVEMEKQVETSEKTFVKESSKGLRNLLKFGRKHHASTSVDQSVDSECSSRDGAEHDNHAKKVASSSEVNTLKNLISHEESSTAGNAPQKTSRHFSLLSPFRSKTSEKKQSS